MALTFDDSTGRFRGTGGRFVSEPAVRAVIDDIADGSSERMAALSRSMLAGDLSLAEWQAGMGRIIKQSHVAAATIAHGGEQRMTAVEYGRAGQAIRTQYDYLTQFAAQIASAEQPLTDGLVARARQYGQAARPLFEREYGRDQMQRGYQSERNVLGAARDHCTLCPELSARGWVPIGSLPPVGSRPCRSQDRCRIEYRREAALAA